MCWRGTAACRQVDCPVWFCHSFRSASSAACRTPYGLPRRHTAPKKYRSNGNLRWQLLHAKCRMAPSKDCGRQVKTAAAKCRMKVWHAAKCRETELSTRMTEAAVRGRGLHSAEIGDRRKVWPYRSHRAPALGLGSCSIAAPVHTHLTTCHPPPAHPISSSCTRRLRHSSRVFATRQASLLPASTPSPHDGCDAEECSIQAPAAVYSCGRPSVCSDVCSSSAHARRGRRGDRAGLQHVGANGVGLQIACSFVACLSRSTGGQEEPCPPGQPAVGVGDGHSAQLAHPHLRRPQHGVRLSARGCRSSRWSCGPPRHRVGGHRAAGSRAGVGALGTG